MQTTAATVRAVSMYEWSRQPTAKKMMHVNSKVAMVMPEIGLEEEPISPVRREETVTNKKPKTRIIMAPMKPVNEMSRPMAGMHMSTITMPTLPTRTATIDMSRSVRRVACGPPERVARRSRKPETMELK